MFVPTMKDIAKKAGVSLGTVSNVLNHLSSVKPQNYEKVMAAVRDLDYTTNMTARALRTKQSGNIGLIIPSITNPYYPELARGVEDAASDAGLTVFLCNDDREEKKERGYIDALLTKMVDGIILVKPTLTTKEANAIRKQCGLVLVDRSVHMRNTKGHGVIDVDDWDGVEKAMRLLHQNGHTKIGFINGLMETVSSRNRFNAYKRYLRQHRLPFLAKYVVPGNWTYDSGYEAARTLMALPHPPTAIVCANDIMAFGAMKAFQDKGLRIPEDVSVVGFDNIALSNVWSPALTTLNQPKYDIGRKSVSMLLEQIGQGCDGTTIEGCSALFDIELIIRSSVGINPKGS